MVLQGGNERVQTTYDLFTFLIKQPKEGVLQVWEGQVTVLTVCVYTNDEVISHGLGLSQLVGVAVMDHVIAGRKET